MRRPTALLIGLVTMAVVTFAGRRRIGRLATRRTGTWIGHVGGTQPGHRP